MKILLLLISLSSLAYSEAGTTLRDQDFSSSVPLILPSSITVVGPQTEKSTLTVVGQDSSGNSVKLSSGLTTPLGTITANMFKGNGSELTGIAASSTFNFVTVSSIQFSGNGTSGSSLTLNGSSVTLQGNIFNNRLQLVQIDASGNIVAFFGIVAATGTFSQFGNNLFSIYTSSGIKLNNGIIDLSSSPSSGVRFYDGSIATTAALNVSSGSSVSGASVTFTGGVIENAFTVNKSSLTVYQGGIFASSAAISGPLTVSSGSFTSTGSNQYSIQSSSSIRIDSGCLRFPSGRCQFDAFISNDIVLASPDTTHWRLGVTNLGATKWTITTDASTGDVNQYSPDGTRWKLGVTNSAQTTWTLNP